LKLCLNGDLRRPLTREVRFYFASLLHELGHVGVLVINVADARQTSLRSAKIERHHLIVTNLLSGLLFWEVLIFFKL